MKKATEKTVGKANSDAGDVEAYLAKVPEPARTTLEKLRATIRSAAPPETTEKLSYGIPAFHYKGGLGRLCRIQKTLQLLSHASVPDRRDERRAESLSDRQRYTSIPKDKPLPPTLVKKMVKARIAENEGKRRDPPPPSRTVLLSGLVREDVGT